jgi:hypothetical protein
MPARNTQLQKQRKIHERRRQLRSLLVIALVVLLFSLYRAGLHNVFTPGWWHLW